MQVDDASASTTLMLLGENEDDVGPLKITPLKTLLDTTKPGAYYILADMSSIDNTPDWCYLGCTDCNKKVVPDHSQFKCSGCDLMMTHRVYKECNEILGASAFLLRELMLEVGVHTGWALGVLVFDLFVTDPRILKKYEHLVPNVTEEIVEDGTDDLWNSLEDLSQKVGEVIGSNNPSSSQTEATSGRKIDAIESGDPIKRQLLDELSTTTPVKKVKREALEK
ncbi:hypothetical protein DM860_010226 [Cuscuta australis]|uniref:Replication factor A C-terminal domain-containing protein n=1 Tax=Cuscuta australis TaxID=267555 RepID=A0A328D6E2_9ASTE|nr:hypothetical protein DM860_010226 [Cuscuta australis]